MVYTFQGLDVFTDPDHDGASLLAPGQRSYTVLGQAFLKARIRETTFKAYRQSLDTPLLNPRAAYVDASKSFDYEDYNDYRVIINYDFSVF